MNIYLTEEAIYAPCIVSVKDLDLNRLYSWKEILECIPVGTGLKGGLARKILKVICGHNNSRIDFINEMNDDGDIDLLVAFKDEITRESSLRLRYEFEGMMLGDMKLEAKDIEISKSLGRYFITRDVTMNECLVFRTSHWDYQLFYTEQAAKDIINGFIRPSVHCLHNGFSQVWRYWRGRPVVGRQNFARSIIRYLKGHGLRYAIDQHTFDYYRQKGMSWTDLWRIFKPFHKEPEKYLMAMRHLEEDLCLIRFNNDTDRLTFWGRVLYEINKSIARHGQILSFAEPSAERIEDWLDHKSTQYTRWVAIRNRLMHRGVDVIPDGEYLIYLPNNLKNFPAYYE